MRWYEYLLRGILAGGAHASKNKCSPSAIQAALPEGASVNFAYPVKAGETFKVPQSDTFYKTDPTGLPALCAVSVQVKSVGDSTYGFGLFLPDEWNDRFLAVGNGGFAGGIHYLDMSAGARYGFATMSTDTGHNSSVVDGTWAANAPEKVENWGHLAMHGSTVTAKLITASYYKKKISYNYYSGCSTGGRQGLKEAEEYPEDFDGIVAGAPAWFTKRMQPWTVKIALYNLPATADYHIPPVLYPVIGKEVLKQCDSQDGLTDSIISDPVGCKFEPEKLLCAEGATDDCLTSPQLNTLYNIYHDTMSSNQTYPFPSFYLGSEGDWAANLPASGPSPLGTHYVQYFLGLGKDWQPKDFNEDIERLADEQDPGNATVGYDLSAYHRKGGKILSYHGLSDASIPTGSTPLFHDQVQQQLSSTGVDVNSFFRYFLVPGMGHCSRTTDAFKAPWYFAGPNQASVLGNTVHSVPGFEDEQHDALLAMMAWVEKGKAPEAIIATKYEDESKHDKVHRQRPLCMLPKVAKYKGQGNADEAKNWECK
ncbi:unnamed protein product [Periconia digitata]|uniref:Carboxylic ester hydrolase n=1 Tax=Periconia digitata TaxID=1303443 RepID=A0A9W4XNA7_9PLEO|nr:unnamed protein product [Periconia digitata]